MSQLGDRWGAETSPSGLDLYTQGAGEIAPGIVEYAQQIKTAGETLFEAVMRARNTLQMSDYQRQLLDLQYNRAATGQPPLDLSGFGIGQPQERQMVPGISNTALLLLVLAAVFLLMPKGRGS